MQRWLTLLMGALAIGLAVVVVYRSTGDRPPLTRVESAADADPPVANAADAGPRAEGGSDDPFAALPATPAAADTRGGDTGPGSHLPDGRPAPPLPEGTPKQVRIGVVIVAYAGAQGTTPGSRSKKEALEVATKLAADAKTDFHGAVLRGDSGSADDVGHIPRGVLELGTEYVVFTMPVGTISDLLETPRGYWIVKRLD
jgi:hypothetical protein